MHKQDQGRSDYSQGLFRLVLVVHMDVHVPGGLCMLPELLLPGLVSEAHLLSIYGHYVHSPFCVKAQGDVRWNMLTA